MMVAIHVNRALERAVKEGADTDSDVLPEPVIMSNFGLVFFSLQ